MVKQPAARLPPARRPQKIGDWPIEDLVSWILEDFLNFGHLVMDEGANEAVEGGGDIA